jgi:transcription initiation factor TFIID TATA-box-binding protein
MIRNVISTADLKQTVDAQKFINYSWGKYDVEYYGGRCGYVKDETISGRVTVFLSGKMISTGANSLTKSIKQLKRTRNLLVDNHFIKNVRLVPKIQNIVATANIGTRIDLNEVARRVPKITFEPEQFSGAILRTSQKQVCLIFSSGKIVIVGSTSEGQLSETTNKMKSMLIDFFVPFN